MMQPAVLNTRPPSLHTPLSVSLKLEAAAAAAVSACGTWMGTGLLARFIFGLLVLGTVPFATVQLLCISTLLLPSSFIVGQGVQLGHRRTLPWQHHLKQPQSNAFMTQMACAVHISSSSCHAFSLQRVLQRWGDDFDCIRPQSPRRTRANRPLCSSFSPRFAAADTVSHTPNSKQQNSPPPISIHPSWVTTQ